jgi:CBS domain-containing protein
MPERPVRDIIERSAIVTAPSSQTVRKAAAAMAEHKCGSILVVDDGRLVGIFTERDLLTRVVAAGKDVDTTPLGDVMTREPETIDADRPVIDAIRMMDEESFRYLPVMENDRLIGVISAKDLPYSEIGRIAREMTERHALAERIW